MMPARKAAAGLSHQLEEGGIVSLRGEIEERRGDLRVRTRRLRTLDGLICGLGLDLALP